MASSLQFGYRTQKALNVFEAAPVYEQLDGFARYDGNSRCCAYSPCGRYFSWASPEAVSVHDASSGRVVTALPIPNVIELGHSPQGTFLITLERPTKDDAGDAAKNLKVWKTIEDGVQGGDKQPIGRFVQKSHTDFNLQYTADEKYCARLVSNEIQFFESTDLATVWDRLRVEGVANFALSPGGVHSVAVYVPERKGQPAVVKVFNLPQFSTPVSQKTFFKGDKVKLEWNREGSSILVLAQTEVDKSNKSYYGESTLYLLSATGGFEAGVTLDKEGPIHYMSWSPNSKEFGVVYGFMPAKAKIFNHHANATHEFPTCPRNEIHFSPSGRFALVAGLGNLAGQIDIYDLEKDYRKICTIESGNPSVCEWSPDSRYIMTATLSPRLRVDNGVKLWHVSGALMYNEDMVELLHIEWKPMPAASSASGDILAPVPPPHASATAYLGNVKTPSKPAGAYRPPGARGTATPLHFKREDEGGAAHVMSNGISSLGLNGFGRPRRTVPGAELAEPGIGTNTVPGAEPADGDGNLSKAALKNKKKRERGNKKAKEGEAQAKNPAELSGGGVSLAPPLRDFGGGSGSEGRSPERRAAVGHHRHHRSLSRNHPGQRARSSTNRGPQYGLQQPGQHGAATPPSQGRQNAMAANGAAQDAQNPAVKKIRSLQKKLRAIEDLEMRLARSEKLEDTQMKKIATKDAVIRELEGLGGHE